MNAATIDFKVDGKYSYVRLRPPVKNEQGEAEPDLVFKEFQCLIVSHENSGVRYVFTDENKDIYYCRRLPYYSRIGHLNIKNLIEKRDRDKVENIDIIYAPLLEIESNFRLLMQNPKDEKHKFFCEKAVNLIEEFKCSMK